MKRFPRNIYDFATKQLKLKIVFGQTTEFHTEYGKRIITIYTDPRSMIQFPTLSLELVGRELAHELGHYFIAPKGRRHRKDYGIVGFGEKWDLDEAKAILVEHELLRFFGAKKVLKCPLSRVTLAFSIKEQKKSAIHWFNEQGKEMIHYILKDIK